MRLFVSDWAESGPSSNVVLSDGSTKEEVLPLSIRRRVTALGRQVLSTSLALIPEGEIPRLVFSSRHGEYGRTLGILQSLATTGEVSPAEFSMSVHHALAGLLSIHTNNTSGHTAIAAGPDSFGYGLLEAALAAQEDQAPSLFVYYDEPIDQIYSGVVDDFINPIIIAILLHPSKGQELHLGRSHQTSPGHEDVANQFLHFLRSDVKHAHAKSGTTQWEWSRVH